MSKSKATRQSANAIFAAHAAALMSLAGVTSTGCAEVDVIEPTRPAVEPPTAVLKSTPAALMRLKTATFEFEAEGAASFLCKLDASAPEACSSPFVTPVLSDGSHVFSVAARDAEGNTQAIPTLFQWNINSSLAGIIIDSMPAAFTNAATAGFSFSSDEEMEFTCKLNGEAPINANAITAQTATCEFSGLQDGDYEVTVTGANEIGNQNASYEWTVDTVRPIFTKTAEIKNSVAGKYELDYVVSEPAGASTCTLAWTQCETAQTLNVPCGISAGNTSGKLTINRSNATPACRIYTLSTSFTDRAGNSQLAGNKYSTTFNLTDPNLPCPFEACPEGPGGEN